jgi:septal ring factor EnvC (AmiA/AmiB activator)
MKCRRNHSSVERAGLVFRGEWARALVLLVALGCATSCREDPDLLRKRDAQKAEIAALQSELALVDAKLATMPEDVSGELEKVRLETVANEKEIARLEAELEALAGRKRGLQAEFDSYRAKYPVNPN